MRRRSFLLAAGAAAVSSSSKPATQTSPGILTSVQSDGLWIREFPGSVSTKIAPGAGLHSPRISPSGRWVSYRNPNLAIVRSDGGSQVNLESETGVWLPHADRLAIVIGSDIAVFGPANAWKSPLAVWKDSGLPLASPDRKRFVAVRTHERPSDPNGLYEATAELYTASFAAPETTQVLLSSEGAIEPWGWTRDGKSILYWRADEWSGSLWSDGVDLYSIPASRGPERKLGIQALNHQEALNLAPDSAGNWLAVSRSDGRMTWAGQQIAIVDPDTGASRNLTPPDIAALCPAWSPDGLSILCVAAPDADVAYKKAMNGVNIQIMNPTGTRHTEVVTPVANISSVGGGEEAHAYLNQRKIWLLDPSGTNPPRPLTSDPMYRDEEPLWSADGSHILFARMDRTGHSSLWLMEKTGANPIQVCTLAADDWFGYYGYIDWRSSFDWRL